MFAFPARHRTTTAKLCRETPQRLVIITIHRRAVAHATANKQIHNYTLHPTNEHKRMSNTDVIKYLHQYYGESTPQYAVFVSGKWGAGKSWYVRESLREPDMPFVWISLYGMKNTAEISEAIDRALNPKLNSAAGHVGLQAVRGIFKKWSGLDLNDLKRKRTPTEFIKKTSEELFIEKGVFIFDDLERTSIPIVDVLGYINGLIEYAKARVVVIGNPEEFGESQRTFLKTNEKLIGKTLLVSAAANEAIPAFLSDINEFTESIIKQAIPVISDIFAASKSDNLRSLRAAFRDADRILSRLDPKLRKNSDLAVDLLRIFIAVSIELRSAKIDFETIKKLANYDPFWAGSRWNKDTPPEQHEVFMTTYQRLLPTDWLLSGETWERLFRTGLVDTDQVNSELLKCHYFTQLEPSWIILRKYWRQEDHAFQRARHDALLSLDKGEIQSPSDLLILAVTMFQLIDDGLLDLTQEQLHEKISNALSKIKTKNLISQIETLDEDGWSIHNGVRDKHIEPIEEIRAEFVAKARAVELEEFRQNVPALLAKFSQNPKELLSDLSERGKFRIRPVLAVIETAQMGSAIERLSVEDAWNLNGTLRLRYQHPRSELVDEVRWLPGLIEALKKSAVDHPKTPRGHVLSVIAGNLEIVIKDWASVSGRL